LENPIIAPHNKTKKQKAKDAYKRFVYIKSYKLQDGQLYRKAKTDKRTRIIYLAQYAATYSGAFKNIYATHELLMHFSKQ